MADDRPRPQYGEYATPEQQAAAMGKRAIPPLRVLPEMPTPPDRPPGTVSPPPDAANRVPARGRQHHPIDRIVTFVLLGVGLYSLLDGLPSYFAFGATLTRFARAFDVSYTAPAAANPAGYEIAAAQLVLFLLALVFSARRVRGGRFAFWIPLAGYLIFDAAAFVILELTVPGFLVALQSYVATQQ